MKRIFLILLTICLGMVMEATAQSTEQEQKEQSIVGNYDRVVSLVINDCVRHEKRFLSQTDVFRIHINPKGNLLSVVSEAKDEFDVNFVAFISPKDTTIKPQLIEDGERYYFSFVSKSSETIMLVNGTDSLDRYDVCWYSKDDVIVDYSGFPNRMYKAKGTLFVWRDDSYDESNEVINTLIEYNRVDYWVKDCGFWGAFKDGEEIICYDLNALREGKIKKYHDYGLFGKGFRGRIRWRWYELWRPND